MEIVPRDRSTVTPMQATLRGLLLMSLFSLQISPRVSGTNGFRCCRTQTRHPSPTLSKRSSTQSLNVLRGGQSSEVVSHVPDEVYIGGNNRSCFQKVVEMFRDSRIRVEGGQMYFWDWRTICPWSKRAHDEDKEFPLEPLGPSNQHFSAWNDRPAHFDGQWKFRAWCSGSFHSIHLSHYTEVLDARIMFVAKGGPWNFQNCQAWVRAFRRAPSVHRATRE